MQLDMFNAFCNSADFSGVIFYYNGELSQNVIATMGDALKGRLEEEGNLGPKSRKLFSSYIEMVQNALHYSPPTPKGGKIGAVAVGKKQEDKYFIVCGNLVRREHMERIRDKIEPLQKMTIDEIKKAYREQLRNDRHSEDALSKGAGLGFLTVARDASEPIEYAFDAVPGNDELARFYLKAIV